MRVSSPSISSPARPIVNSPPHDLVRPHIQEQHCAVVPQHVLVRSARCNLQVWEGGRTHMGPGTGTRMPPDQNSVPVDSFNVEPMSALGFDCSCVS